MPDRAQQIYDLYQAALTLKLEDRKALLQKADPELRGEVEALLQQNLTLLDRPAWEYQSAGKGTQLGPYVIDAPIGAGGMGQVYRAVDTRLGRTVAIKIASQDFSGRFEREAKAIAQLNHPHICTLHDVGANYLVMELVEGETLAAKLARAPLSVQQVLEYGSQIADALTAAHGRGIVHRDLKPGNIMLTSHGAKVLDFGLAKFEGPDESLTQTGTVMGTLMYMAPEQVKGAPVEPRTDLFSLGLILYEMAAGRLPVAGASLGNMMATDPRVPVTPPSRVRSGLPSGFDGLVLELLQDEPHKRPANAAAVRDRLRLLATPKNPSRSLRTALAAALIAALAVGGWWFAGGDAGPPELQHTHISEIAPFPGNKQDPAISPDLTTVAFSWNGERGDSPGIYVMPIKGGEPRRITRPDNRDISPAWSPDSRRIAFLRVHLGQRDELMTVTRDGETEVKVREVRMPEQVRRTVRPIISWTTAGIISFCP